MNNQVKHGILLSAAVVFLLMSGCVEVDPSIQGRRSGSLSPMTNTVYHGCGYTEGPWGEPWNAGGDRRHSLYSVRMKYNVWYAVAAVCSLGLYMPMDMEWRYDLGEEGDGK